MNTHIPAKIGIITHDLISAIRGSEIFTYYGVTPTLVLDGIIARNLDVIATTSMSKIATPRMAYLQTKKAISRCHGRYLCFQENLFLMGNISADIKAIIDVLQPGKLIFCTAWPEHNSYIKGAQAFIGNIPVSKSVQAIDAVTPIRESNIPHILEKYTGLTPKLLNTDEVERGPTTIARLVNTCSNRIIICDATKQDHLKNIAEAIVCNKESWVACGSGGLTREMIPLLGYKKQQRAISPLLNKKPVLLVLGSLSDVTAIQLATAAEKGLVYPILIEPGDLWNRNEREYKIHKLAVEAGQQTSRGNNVAIALTCSRFIPQFRKTAAYLLSQIAKLVIEEHNTQALCIGGSDTAYAFCRTMSIQKLEVKGSITGKLSSTVVNAYSANGKTYWLCLKPGSYGDELTLVETLQFLRQV